MTTTLDQLIATGDLILLIAAAVSWWPWPLTVSNPNTTPLVPVGPSIAAVLVTAVACGRRAVTALLATPPAFPGGAFLADAAPADELGEEREPCRHQLNWQFTAADARTTTCPVLRRGNRQGVVVRRGPPAHPRLVSARRRLRTPKTSCYPAPTIPSQ
jgi:hypothetical protein